MGTRELGVLLGVSPLHMCRKSLPPGGYAPHSAVKGTKLLGFCQGALWLSSLQNVLL